MGSSWDLMRSLGGEKRLMERLGVALWSPSASPGAVLGSAWTSDPPAWAFSGGIVKPYVALCNESDREAHMFKNIAKCRSEWPSGGRLVAQFGVQFGLRADRCATCPCSSLRTSPPYRKRHSGRRSADRRGLESPDPDPRESKKSQIPYPDICRYTFIYLSISLFIYTHIHTYIHTRIYIYIYIHII